MVNKYDEPGELNMLAIHDHCDLACPHFDNCLQPCDKSYDKVGVGCFAYKRGKVNDFE